MITFDSRNVAATESRAPARISRRPAAVAAWTITRLATSSEPVRTIDSLKATGPRTRKLVAICSVDGVIRVGCTNRP